MKGRFQRLEKFEYGNYSNLSVEKGKLIEIVPFNGTFASTIHRETTNTTASIADSDRQIVTMRFMEKRC